MNTAVHVRLIFVIFRDIAFHFPHFQLRPRKMILGFVLLNISLSILFNPDPSSIINTLYFQAISKYPY